MYNVGFGDDGAATQVGETSLSLKACPTGYKSVISKYTGRKLCVAVKAATSPCPPGFVLKFYPLTRKVACAPAPGVAAAATRAAEQQKTQSAAKAAQQKKASMISALRGKPALQAPAQALKQIYAGGPTGGGAAMALSAKARLSGERQQTANMSPLIQQAVGVKSGVTASGAGTLAKKDYTPNAVAATKGWMPGCRMVCPTTPAPAQAPQGQGLTSAAMSVAQQISGQIAAQAQKPITAAPAASAMGVRVRLALPAQGK